MKEYTWLMCPYCDLELSYEAKSGYQIIECDLAERGCGRKFVARIKRTMSATTLRIEGE